MKNNRAIEIMIAVALVLVGLLSLVPTQASDPHQIIAQLHANYGQEDVQKRTRTYQALTTPEFYTKLTTLNTGCKHGNVYTEPHLCASDYDPAFCDFNGKELYFKNVGNGIYEAEHAPADLGSDGKIFYRFKTVDGTLRLDGTRCVTSTDVFW
jgi:hypothetical protein